MPRAGGGVRGESHFPLARTRSEWIVATAGAAIAFLLAHSYAARHSLQTDWAQHHLSPAINYACTGRFAAVRLAPDAGPADVAALDQMSTFLRVGQLEFPCRAFPQRVQDAAFFDGIEAANAEQPLYLIALYALLWRWFGVHWALTYYVIAATVAASFVLMYRCTRRFASPAVAVGATALFLSSPFFISNVLSPRDAFKTPFAVAIAALLIACGTATRTPARFIGFAALSGLVIGVGYGFRSDILFLLAPAALISCLPSLRSSDVLFDFLSRPILQTPSPMTCSSASMCRDWASSDLPHRHGQPYGRQLIL